MIGDKVKEVFELIESNANENANSMFSNNFVEVQFQGMIQKELIAKYDLDNIDEMLYKLYESGFYHIHDIIFWMRMNCLQHAIYKLYMYGLDALSCKSAPAKHLDTALSHTINALSLGQSHFAGGQSIPMFNVFIAPFCKGVSDEDMEQYIQQFVFQANQISPSRGLQTIFMSLNFEFVMPQFMEDMPVGYKEGTFGDYEEEMIRFTKIFLKVLNKGDYNNKPFMFPNCIFNVRTQCVDMELMNLVTKNMVENSNCYLLNGIVYGGQLGASMGCRTYTGSTVTGDPFIDVLGTGNMSYITLNIPRLAMTTKTKAEFFKELDFMIDNAVKVLLVRRNRIWKCMNEHLYPFVQNELYHDHNGYYYNLEHTTMGIGVVGLEEAIMYNKNLSKENILKFISFRIKTLNDYSYKEIADELNVPYEHYNGRNETTRFSVIGSPAESCSERFKKLDSELYGNLELDELKNKGYYTNSIMVLEDSEMSGHQKIMEEQKYHKYLDGGIITHLWNASEPKSDYTKLSKYLLLLMENTKTRYLTISNLISHCEDCGTKNIVSKMFDECKHCGSKNVKFYQKVTGYLTQVDNYNKGKKKELENRSEFKL